MPHHFGSVVPIVGLSTLVPTCFVRSHNKYLNPFHLCSFILHSNFFLPFITKFFAKVEIPGIHLTIFVKSAHTYTFHEKKSAYFSIWNILFLLSRWENLVFTLIPEVLHLLLSKMPCDGFLIKTTLPLLINMVEKAVSGHKRQKSRRGVSLRNNTLMFSFYWCNTVLCDTSIMEFSLHKKAFACLGYNRIGGKRYK